MKKKVLIACFALALAAGGVVAWYQLSHLNNEGAQQKVSNDTTPAATPTPTPAASDDDQPKKTNDSTWPTDELFSAQYARATEILNKMSTEEKVGQVFLARYPETQAEVQKEISAYYPGGYVMFGRDFADQTKSSVIARIDDNQSRSKQPMIFGVDEEGGTVVRVSAYRAFRAVKFWSPQALYEKGGMNLVLSDAREKDTLLKSLGLNLNLAPVADLPTYKGSFMYARSFGTDAQLTSNYVSQVVAKMKADGLSSTLKHFPGYGDNVDTHTGIAVDKRDCARFEAADFKPFEAGIAAGAPTILVNHNIVNCMDSTKPASLSAAVHDKLRTELKYSGIIMTDDLGMDAVKTYVTNGSAAVDAMLAGNDMIITSNFAQHYTELLAGVKDGRVSEDMLNMAVRRVLAWKLTYGIIK